MANAPDPFSTILAQAEKVGPALTRFARDAGEAEMVGIVLRSVSDWAAKRIDAPAIDESHRIPPELLAEAAELGLFGMTIPEAHGGFALSMTAACRVVEELALFDRSVATAIGLHCGLGLRGLIHHANPTLQAATLPAMATGDKIGAFAATEPGAGSHIAGMKTTGKVQEDGSIVLNGQKIYVTNGGFADYYTVVAKTPGLAGARRGWSLFLLHRDDPGLSVGAEEHKLGIRGSSTTTLSLDDVRVGMDRIIGEPSNGLEAFHEILAWGRTMMAAGCLGSARAAYKLTLGQVTSREQFNRPIGHFGQVREKMADMRATIYAMESLVRLVTVCQEHLGMDINFVSSVAKIFNSEGSWQVADDALQLHGGSGYVEETGVARILRDARITRIFEGANEVLRFNLAALALGGVNEAHEVALLAPCVRHPELAAAAAVHDDAAQRIQDAAKALLDRYGFKAFERQMLLKGIADAQIARTLLLAVVEEEDLVTAITACEYDQVD